MDFPIDVIRTENKIILIRGELTKDFFKKLSYINDRICEQNEYDHTFLLEDHFGDETDFEITDAYGTERFAPREIRLGGTQRSKHYKYLSIDKKASNIFDDDYTKEEFDKIFTNLKKLIAFYKEQFNGI